MPTTVSLKTGYNAWTGLSCRQIKGYTIEILALSHIQAIFAKQQF
jgi:hypothetical protein